MMTFYRMSKTVFALVLFAFVWVGCTNDLPDGNDPADAFDFRLYLTDCPFEAEEVNVEILGVSIKDSAGTIQELMTNAGVYDLLEFTDGIDTLLAFGNLDIDNVKHLYFEIGDQNSIVVDGEVFPLQVKGDPTIKVNVNLDKLEDADYLVDFYACTSIIKNNNGYFIKPVIKFKGKKNGNNGDGLEDLLEDFETCYELVFPITLLDEAGESYEATDEESLIDILTQQDIETVEFPIQLLNEDDEIIEIASEEALEELEDCDEDEEDEDDEDENEEFEELFEDLEDCYALTYPISFIDADSMTVTANNENQLEELLEDAELVSILFPIEITNNDGELIEVQNLDDLEEYAECDEDDDEDDDEEDDDEEEDELEELIEDVQECYSVTYPISLVTEDSITITINSTGELESIFDSILVESFVYPIELVDDMGGVLLVNSDDELEEAGECEDDEDDECEDVEEIIEDLEDCYTVSFPVNVVDEDGVEFTANNINQLEDLFEDQEIEDFVFPVELISNDGEVFTINDCDTFSELDDDC